MIMTMHEDMKVNEKQFNEIHLRTVVDYATEAAFIASMQGGNLGISYQDLQSVQIEPQNALTTFKSAVALSYDMSVNPENLRMLDHYISSAVVALSDGYYIATMEEITTDGNLTDGGEYGLMWGLKKPYSIGYGPNRYVAYSLGTEDWVLAQKESDGSLKMDYGETFDALDFTYNIPDYDYNDNTDADGKEGPDRKQKLRREINTRINTLITQDINQNIKERNEKYKQIESQSFVYLPSQTTSSGINRINKPSLFITMSGVDFAGSQKLSATSVGGLTVIEKRRVLGFLEDVDGDGTPEKYYCYETQIPAGLPVEQFYNSVEEAALAGYRPHVDYLRNPILIQD